MILVFCFLLLFNNNIHTIDRKYSFKKSKTNRQRVFREEDYILLIRGSKFRQGDLVVIKLYIKNKSLTKLSNFQMYWKRKKLQIGRLAQNYFIAFFPIHPDLTPGKHSFGFQYLKDKQTHYKYYDIKVRKAPFHKKRKRRIKPLKFSKKYSPKRKLDETTIKFIKECLEIKKKVYSKSSPLMINGNFGMPLVRNVITSPFYKMRYYSSSGRSRPHSGTDLRGSVGTPIYAIQRGKVVISSNMYFEGLFTVIDHGHKIFSLYMHQSKSFVKVGEIVQKGDLIGRIGKTGRVTGPHLHWGMRVDDVLVNPLSVVNLRIFH